MSVGAPGPAPVPPFRHPGAATAGMGAAGAALVGAATALGPLEGLAALAAVVTGMLVIRHPVAGALALVAATPVLSGLRRGLPVPALRLSEILIAGIAGLILLTADWDHQRRWRAVDWLALAYAAVTVVFGVYGLVARGLPVGSDTLRTLTGPIQYLLLYRAVVVALPSAEHRRRALWLVLALSVPEALLAILQQLHLAAVRDLIPQLTGVEIDRLPGREAEGQRATGTFPHWQVLAGYLFWILLLAVALFLDPDQRAMSRRGLVVVMGLGFAAVLSTVTFAAILGVVVGAVLLGVWAGRVRRVAVVVLLGSIVAVGGFHGALDARYHKQFDNPAHDRPAWLPQTVDYRMRLWTDQYLPVLSGRWLTGYGPDLPPQVRFPYTESLYMTLLLRGGLPLLAVYLALMLAMLLAGVRSAASTLPEPRAASRALVVGLVLLSAMHFIEPYFILTGVAHLIWITAALVVNPRDTV